MGCYVLLLQVASLRVGCMVGYLTGGPEIGYVRSIFTYLAGTAVVAAFAVAAE